jgi:gluconokinase
MGVSGSGKSTVAKPLAAELGWTFKEGDELHPAANIAKMKAGAPLTDADRRPWLAAIGAWIDREIAADRPGVVTCSALRRAYRDFLRAGRPQLEIVYLCGSPELIAGRLERRKGHFMPPSLLGSQVSTLEPPTPDENVITIDIDQSVAAQVAAIRTAIGAG